MGRRAGGEGRQEVSAGNTGAIQGSPQGHGEVGHPAARGAPSIRLSHCPGPHQWLLQRARPRGPAVLPGGALRGLPRPWPRPLRRPPVLPPLALERLRAAQHLQPRARRRLPRARGPRPRRARRRRHGQPAVLRELQLAPLPRGDGVPHLPPGLPPGSPLRPGADPLRGLRPHRQVRHGHALLLHVAALGLRPALPAAHADARVARTGRAGGRLCGAEQMRFPDIQGRCSPLLSPASRPPSAVAGGGQVSPETPTRGAAQPPGSPSPLRGRVCL